MSRLQALTELLVGHNAIHGCKRLNYFVKEAEDKKAFIKEFLSEFEFGADAVMYTLKNKKLKYGVLKSIFDCISNVLYNLTKSESSHRAVALNIAQKVLGEYVGRVHEMLRDTRPDRNRSILFCLTGMVLHGGEAACEVLKFLKSSGTSFHGIRNFRNLTEPTDVREFYVELILTFMTIGDPYVMEKFLAEPGMLTVMLRGLKEDRNDLALKVLKTMHEGILLNPLVTKTTKMNLFTPEVTKSLIALYEWQKAITTDGLKDEEAAKKALEKEAEVRVEVQKLLLTICSSEKYGILIRQKENQSIDSNLNKRVFDIIRGVKKPWETSEGRKLMAVIFAACPDLLRRYLDSVQYLLHPRASEAFTSLVEMLVEIMKCQKPWQFAESRGWESAVSCILPGAPLSPNFYSKLSQSEDRAVRHVGCTLMLTVLRKVKETLEIVKDLGLPSEVREKIQKEVIKRASNTFTAGTTESVIRNWKNVLEILSKDDPDTEEEGRTDVGNLPPTIEVIAIVEYFSNYNKVVGSSAIEEVLDTRDILKTLQFVKKLEVNELKSSAVVKKEFWTACLDLLNKSTRNRKFDLNTPDLEDNMFYILIRTLAQYQGKYKVDHLSKDNADLFNVFVDILLCCLDRAGISDDCQGFKYWMRYVSSAEPAKLSAFLTHVIQQTLSSYNTYTDCMIELGEKYADTGCSTLIMNQETLSFEDRGQSAVLPGFNKPFSRLILAAVDLLSANPDAECTKYFSSVVNDYLHTLYNPGLLISFLLEKESVIDDSLKEYLGSFVKHPEFLRKEPVMLDDDTDLSVLLKLIFMTQDWWSASQFLETVDVTEMIKSDLHLTVMQLLMYLLIELEKEKCLGEPMAENYAELLKNLYVSFREKDEQSAATVVKTVLEHPKVMSSYSPFSPDESLLSSLCQYFIEVILEEHAEVSLCTYPYYLRILKVVKTTRGQLDAGVDFWSVVSPFFTSEHTILTYKDVEEMLVIYLNKPLSPCHGPFLCQLLDLFSKSTTAKKQPQEETLQLIFSRYLEWNLIKGERFQLQRGILASLEHLLLRVMTRKISKEISQGDLERLLLCCPPSPDLCRQVVEWHPPHGVFFASRLKDYDGDLVVQSRRLLAILLRHEESKSDAQKALLKLQGPIKDWAMNMEDDNECYKELFLHSLNADVIDMNDMTDICVHAYEKIVQENVLPTKDITSFLILFQKVSGSEEAASKLQLGDSHLTLLEIVLNIIKIAYKKNTPSSPVLHSCSNMLEVVLQNVDGKQLQKSLTNKKSWQTFVKQVLRTGLSDVTTGPQMIHSLNLMVETLYKDDMDVESFEKENDLPLGTIFKMIISHTQYLSLMFQREAEWDKLKESVVALQQTIINHDGNVCMEYHVPALLGAYGASMSAADQRILKLLHTYEASGAMKRIEPVLWGDTAVSHFGNLSASEMYREPKTEHILALLDSPKILKTSKSFDTKLTLVPDNICGDDRTIYDMRFLIPLLLHLAEDEKILEIDFAESGAVAVGFACLSSYDQDVWAAGATLLKCVVDKMRDSRHNRFKLPWLWAITIVSSSLCGGGQRRLAPVFVHFLLRVTRLLSNPQDPMYFCILRSIFIKPAMDLRMVPQLSRLYASGDVFDSRIHMSFLLNFLSTGIRLPEDYFICERTSTAMLIISLLQSPTTDSEIRVQALEVLEAMVRLPVGAQELVNKYNLLTVLPIAVASVSAKPNESEDGADIVGGSGKSALTAAIVRVLHTIWPSMFTISEKKTSTMRSLGFGLKRKRNEEEEKAVADKDDKRNEEEEEEEEKAVAVADKDDDERNEEEEEKAVADKDERVPVAKKFRSDDGDPVVKKFESDDDMSDDDGPASKKFKSEDGVTDTKEHNVGDTSQSEKDRMSNSKPKKRQLRPLFVEEFMNCLLHTAPKVVEHAPLKYVAKHLRIITDTIEYTEENSKLADKETIRVVALDPLVVKERVQVSIPWERLHESLKGYLTDAQLVKIIGRKTDAHVQEWIKEPVFQHQEAEEQDTLCGNEDIQQLKLATFDLLDVLDR